MIKKSGIIYKVVNKTNGKVYIGQTIRGLKTRKADHFFRYNDKDSSTYKYKFAKALRKYGFDNFEWSILYDNIKLSDLDKLEIDTIAKYNSFYNGYNSNTGGIGNHGHKHSRGTKEKLSKLKKGKKVSKETKAKISKSLSGVSQSNERRKSQSIRMTGKGNPFFGRYHSKKTKEKISKTIISMGYSKGKNNPFFGKTHTKKSLKKMAKNRKPGNTIGKNNWQTPYTERDVKKIRKMYATDKYNLSDLSKIFGGSISAISNIINRKSWKHI